MSTPLPAPAPSALTNVVHAVLDTLIKGLGADAAVAAGISAVPWLGFPVLRQLFTYVVGGVAQVIQDVIKTEIDKLIVITEGKIKDSDYQKMVDELKQVTEDKDKSDAEKAAAVDKARKAIDKLVQQGVVAINNRVALRARRLELRKNKDSGYSS